MTEKLNIYLDDERALPPEYEKPLDGVPWIIARNVQSAKALLEDFDGMIGVLSLDHDLGDGQPTGYDLITWVEQRMYDGFLTGPEAFDVHSQNPVGRKRIVQVIGKIEDARR